MAKIRRPIRLSSPMLPSQFPPSYFLRASVVCQSVSAYKVPAVAMRVRPLSLDAAAASLNLSTVDLISHLTALCWLQFPSRQTMYAVISVI